MEQRTNVGAEQKYRKIGGGIEEGESILEGTLREVVEETGLYDLEFQGEIGCCQAFYFAGGGKNVWRENNYKTLLFKINSEQTKEKNLTEYEEDLPLARKTIDERIEESANSEDPDSSADFIDTLQQLKNYLAGNGATTEKGVLIDSGEFSGLTSEEAIKAMQERLKERNLGGEKNNYKIQDWVFSRQRYRGEPFPVVFCKHCGEQTLGEHLHTINFYNQATRNGIVNKTKTIETRALNPEEPERYFGNIKTGEVLKMINKETGEIIYGKITKSYLWKNFEELFNEPELSDVYRDKEALKNVKNVEDLKKEWDFTDGYVEKIEKNGLVGRKFELIDIAQVNPLSESDLPLTLPDVENYEPTGREEGPLDDVK